MSHFNDHYLRVIKSHYFDFEGRAGRQEYWMFVLFNIGISIAISLVFSRLKIPWVASLYSLATLLPSLGLTARRLHDIGKSGWLMLIGFIPLVGLYLIYLLAQDSEAGANAYGERPKASP